MLCGLGAAALTPPLVMHTIGSKAVPLLPDTPAILPAGTLNQTAYFPNSIFSTHEGQ